ncbi:MAG: TonB family protein [Myxococcota bacterium]
MSVRRCCMGAVFLMASSALAQDEGDSDPSPDVDPEQVDAQDSAAGSEDAGSEDAGSENAGSEDAAPENAAPENAAAEDAAPAGPRPPTLLEVSTATLPEGVTLTEHVSVELAILVETDGSVSSAEVLQTSGNPALDAAAQEALLRSRFLPAQQADGTSARARVRYRYDFDPPPPPPSGALVITVRDEADQPLSQARVRVVGSEGEVRAEDASGGVYRYGSLPPGPYEVELAAEGYLSATSTEQVEADVETAVLLRLSPELAPDEDDSDEPTFGATAVVEAPPREVLRRTISGREAASVAGTRGDALRAVEVLPGVARPPFGSGQLIVRGSAPADTQVFLDGVPVPLLYHFGGLTSFLPSPLVDRLDFYPSNFSVRYGRRVGAAVEVRGRKPRSDGFHVNFDVSAVDASLILEAPLSDWGGITAAFRNSLIGYWLTPLLDTAGVSNISAPVYRDYQVMGVVRPTDRDEILLRAYGSRDGFAFSSSEPEDENPFETGRSRLTSDFDRIDLSWERRYNARTRHEIRAALGSRRERFNLGTAQRTVTEVRDLALRSELHHRVGSAFNVRFGIDFIASSYDLEVVGPPPGASEGSFESPEFDVIDVRSSGSFVEPAVYVEMDLFPVEELQIILGLRGDYLGSVEEFTVNPRLAAIYSVTPALRLKAGVGMFSQAPELVEADARLGNPNLDEINAVHGSLGAELDVGDALNLGMEGFYKHLYSRVVVNEGGESPPFVNGGTGRIYGLEINAKLNPTGEDSTGVFGFLSYTLSRSERSDQGDPWRLFDFDQTHVLSTSLGYRFRRGWSLSALFRLASGNPRTPVRRGIYDVASDRYRPVYGNLNGGRDEYFHRLDVRVEKTWRLDPISLTFYLDVQNAYNRQNPEGLNYNYNFTQSETQNGLPIIPSIGLRGEL